VGSAQNIEKRRDHAHLVFDGTFDADAVNDEVIILHDHGGKLISNGIARMLDLLRDRQGSSLRWGGCRNRTRRCDRG
jgi:hypothetical protein